MSKLCIFEEYENTFTKGFRYVESLEEHDKQIRADAINECIALLRQGMNELLESPWANKSYMSNHDFEVREVFGIIDDLIIKKDLEQLKEQKNENSL